VFGYVTPLKDELKIREYTTFKSYYCGLCFHLKKEFGNLPRMTLNYDMTFLAVLLDSLTDKDASIQMRKCMTSPIKKKPIILDNEALSYAANMNVALVYYKLLDDVADNKSLKSRLLASVLSFYKRSFSSDILTVNAVISENLNLLNTLEKHQTFSSIDEICHPFSLIVAYILKMYPFPLTNDTPELREHLFDLGYALGKWIYMIDALDDLEKDMAKQKFNPLNVLYNKNQLPYKELLEQIKDSVTFTILNCGYNCKHHLDHLPLYKNKELLENIISLGMMDRYTKVVNACHCQKHPKHQAQKI
jgi:hypothetical protein